MTFSKSSLNYRHLGLLTLAAFGLFLLNLGQVALRDWDEGYYATVSQDMFQQGEWLFPLYQDQPFLLKPPLLFWLIQASYHLGGIHEWTSRFPSAFLSALAVPLLYLLGRELFSQSITALFSALVYLTLLPAVRLGRLAMFDGMINTFLVGALWCLLKGFQKPPWLLGVGLGLGLIALSKGVLALVFASLMLLFILWEKQGHILGRWELWLGLLLGFSPILLWYGLQIQTYGQEFIQVHFQAQTIDRLATAVEGNSGPPWFYLVEIAKYSAPWLFFALPGLYWALQKRRERWAKVVFIFGLGFGGIISSMSTKLPWYVLPVYPSFALATGYYLTQLWQSPKAYPKFLGALLSLATALVLVALVYFTWLDFQPWLIGLSLTLTLSLALASTLFLRSQRQAIPVLIGGLYLTLAVLMASPLWNWELNEAFAVKPVAALIAQFTPQKTTIYTSFAYSRPSLDFYSDRLVLAVSRERLRELAQSPHYFLLDDAALEELSLPSAQSLGRSGNFTLIKSASPPA
ncbi:glycosyltransferase family 39 protein [Synechocystis sp. LKSZ1]|uniref:ArnT family glycosyltransferase n=1 Tax=Synechocystis sp. LKSZ1 TaxID=3144951 RepID=UPI00336BE5D5